ncbi:hypothetical protein [Aquimarina agarivorans]|uniref:hypothetical protein n=1 Tax=Aquimarina agarivorans TaxID=980584 RepID=UPI000248F564|nr:hypothetical protein [Aquimarina agarivorans]
MSKSAFPSFNANAETKTIDIGLLKKLPPTTTELLINCNNILIIDCIKLTLLNLSLKQVIFIQKDPLSSATFITAGSCFSEYETDQFDYYFTRILLKNTRYPLTSYVKKVHSDLPDDYSIYQTVIENAQIKDYFDKGWFCTFFQLVKLNAEGKKVAAYLKQELEKCDHYLATTINKNPNKAKSFVNDLGGNIFLLKTLNFEIFEHLHTALFSIESIHNEFTIILDTMYLSDNNYIIADLYDFFLKLVSQINIFFSKFKT